MRWQSHVIGLHTYSRESFSGVNAVGVRPATRKLWLVTPRRGIVPTTPHLLTLQSRWALGLISGSGHIRPSGRSSTGVHARRTWLPRLVDRLFLGVAVRAVLFRFKNLDGYH